MSYPSGHATYTTMGLGLISLHLIGRLQLFSTVPARSKPLRGRFQFPLLVLALIPVYVAVFVGVSRAHDYKHDFSDINAGFALGAFSCIVPYLLNYHVLVGALSGSPRERNDSDTTGDRKMAGDAEEAAGDGVVGRRDLSAGRSIERAVLTAGAVESN